MEEEEAPVVEETLGESPALIREEDVSEPVPEEAEAEE
jgi:hypothetical protein